MTHERDVESDQQPKPVAFPCHASLSFVGVDLDPEWINQKLGIEADTWFRRGDQRGTDSLWPHGHWSYSTRSRVASTLLEDHIGHLADIVRQREGAVAEVRSHSQIGRVFCFYLARPGSSGFHVGPTELELFGHAGLTIDVDIYALGDPLPPPETGTSRIQQNPDN